MRSSAVRSLRSSRRTKISPDVGQFSVLTLVWIFRRRPRWSVLVPIFYVIGVQSVSVVAITGTFIGMVLAVQSYFTFHDLGLETRLGAVINMTLVRELGPVLAATMLAGRVGCAMAAELGTMRVTEQIDALETLAYDPIAYLVVPRLTRPPGPVEIRVAADQVAATVNGKSRKISKLQATVMQLATKAASGDHKAMGKFLELVDEMESRAFAARPTQFPLGEPDLEVLRAAYQRMKECSLEKAAE
jgi:hypothetical protein